MWLKNAQIYDSRSRRFRRGDIEVAGERFASLGGKAPAKAEAIDMDGAFLLPGFFDCHVHICVPTDAPDPSRLWVNALPGEIAIYAARSARRLLMCGITTAREVGGWDYHEIAVRESIAAGVIEGPRLYCAGRILTITSSTTPYYRGMYEEADGPEEVRKAARKQLAQGADLIKILATGAVTSTKYEKADAIQYRPEEIAAAVAIARDNLTHVAAHAHANEGIRNAVEAGCRSIEHGSFGEEATYHLMAERGTYLVPTLCTAAAMFKDPNFVRRVPPHFKERYKKVHATRVANMKLARRCDVRMAMGTDAGTPRQSLRRQHAGARGDGRGGRIPASRGNPCGDLGCRGYDGAGQRSRLPRRGENRRCHRHRDGPAEEHRRPAPGQPRHEGRPNP